MKIAEMKKRYPKLAKALKASASHDARIQRAATNYIAKAVELPLRQGVMAGDILFDIWERLEFEHGRHYEFAIDFLAPGTEKDFVAYTIPDEGDMPTRQVQGDYVSIPAYETGNAISWHTKYARDAGWDIPSRAREVIEAGFLKKMNDDAWRVLLASAVDRNIIVYDSQAGAGQFTKRSISLAKLVMRRNGGGNASSLKKFKLTDLYLSPELIEDMRNWGVDEVDEVTRRELYIADDGSERLSRIFGVTLHEMYELGEGQEYQQYYLNSLGASLASGDVELMIGLDQENGQFLHPVREDVRIFPDDKLMQHRKNGLVGFQESGFASVENRSTIAVSA